IGYNNFQLVPHDAGSTAQSGAQAAQAAINDGASLILGPVFADSVRTAKAVAARHNVNIVAFSTDWTLADNRTFLMGFLPFGQVERVVEYAASKGLGKMATLTPSDAYGKAAMQAYQNAAQRSGIQTVSQKTFTPGSASLDADIKAFTQFDQRIVGQTPDGQPQISPPTFDSVFLPAGGDTARSVSNLMNQYGLPSSRVKRLGTGLWDDPVMAQYQELEGAWFAAPSPNLRRDFERRYRELHSSAPPRLATLAYDATALAAVLAQSGLQTSGRPAFDSASITNANGFAGIDGIFRFRANGLVERGLAILEFRRGQMVVIDEAPQSFQGL
ncbi:MAG TPA: penicillin-binding protein activator, partial [Alphaproteobacteria bacterium]|nr:penicillin-binding protein activator [Alphaproteobacteria bacterium]